MKHGQNACRDNVETLFLYIVHLSVKHWLNNTHKKRRKKFVNTLVAKVSIQSLWRFVLMFVLITSRLDPFMVYLGFKNLVKKACKHTAVHILPSTYHETFQNVDFDNF